MAFWKTIVSKIICDAKTISGPAFDMDGCYNDRYFNRQTAAAFGVGWNRCKPAARYISSILTYLTSLILLTTQQKWFLYNTVQKVPVSSLTWTVQSYFPRLKKKIKGACMDGNFWWFIQVWYQHRQTDVLWQKMVLRNRGFGVAASYQAPDGKLFFGAPGKAIMFDPEK